MMDISPTSNPTQQKPPKKSPKSREATPVSNRSQHGRHTERIGTSNELDVQKDRLAIARRSLKDRIVTIVSLTRVLVACVVGVWLGRISVVPSTVRESASRELDTVLWRSRSADKVEVAPRVTVGSPKELFRRLVDWTDPRTPNGVSCSDTKA